MAARGAAMTMHQFFQMTAATSEFATSIPTTTMHRAAADAEEEQEKTRSE